MFRRLLTASLAAWLATCEDPMPSSPTNPSPSAPQSYVVSGIVSETVGGISRPVAGRKVDVYIAGSPCVSGQTTPCIPEKADVVETDQNGRYTVPVTVWAQTLVFVAGAGLHAAGQQPCLASALVDRDTTIDVQIFPTGSFSTPPASAGPMITGLVYETTPQGRKPVRGAWTHLEVGAGDSYPVAKIQTDDAGRFFFCRVNRPVRMVVSEVTNIPGTGDMFFEIELKR